MRLTSYTDLLALFALLAGIATASPVLFVNHDRRRDPASPRIFCTTQNDRQICEKFELPVVRRDSTPLSSRNAYSSTIIGSGQLISGEIRQIQRIMDVKGHAKVFESTQPWLIPDVQVVLWFVLLCCVSEGIVSGLRWWRRPTNTQNVDGKAPRQRDKGRKLGVISESDEDDEANIPVL